MDDERPLGTLQGFMDAVRAVMRGEQANDALAQERRFSRVEAMIDGLQSAIHKDIEGVHDRLDRLNGAVAEQKTWIGGHEVKHALHEGQQSGSASYSARLIAIVAVCATVGGLIVNVISRLLER